MAGHITPPRLYPLVQFFTSPVEVLPARAFFHYRFEVFRPHGVVGAGVFQHSAGESGGKIVGAQFAVAEMHGQRLSLVNNRDGFGSA